MFDLLENIDQQIDERTLVMHTLNGLSDKYEHIATVIRHQKPLPSFVDTRAMFQLEESRLNRTRNQPANKYNSSSPTVLHVRNNNSITNAHNNGPQTCRNFQRGHSRFSEFCRYIHGNGNRGNSWGTSGGYAAGNSPYAASGYSYSQQTTPTRELWASIQHKCWTSVPYKHRWASTQLQPTTACKHWATSLLLEPTS